MIRNKINRQFKVPDDRQSKRFPEKTPVAETNDQNRHCL